MLNIPPFHKGVATLPCEILMSEKQHDLYTGRLFLNFQRIDI